MHLTQIFKMGRFQFLLMSATLALSDSFLFNSRISDADYYKHDPVFPETEYQELQYARIGDSRCLPPLGCFNVTKDFFHPLYRPLNFLPQDRASIGTHFLLYTKEHPKESHDLSLDDLQDIESSPLDPKHRIVFIVHGFFDSKFYGKWMETTKDNLLLHDSYNVIIVDWSKGNGLPYTQAAANARVVGAEIARMIQVLQQIKRISSMDCHIIGHSLGSHIAGYAGERLKKLGRITGLDPAHPYFQNMPASVRLDTTDADFVDVIHTDSSSFTFLALGMSQAIGHVDFYPNNGRSQPGCTHAAVHSILLEGLVDATRRFVSCNHQRATDFFLYSINYKKALPVAYQCTDWENYLEGKCTSCGTNDKKCAIMGIKADHYRPYKNDSQSIKMYLTTSGNAPFWEYMYEIRIKLRKPKYENQDRTGDINIKIQGTKNNYDITLSHKTKNLVHGATYTFLLRRKEFLGEIKGLTFSWINYSWNIFSKPAIFLEFVQITPMNNNQNKKQKLSSKKFCAKTEDSIKSKQAVSLIECK